MKMYLLPLAIALSAGVSLAQSTQNNTVPEEKIGYNALGQQIITTTAVSFMKTPPIAEWASDEKEFEPVKEHKDGRADYLPEGYEEALGFEDTPDPIVQSEMGTRTLRAPIVNFLGLSGNGTPPDPSGAAGPNHYVQAVNTTFRVFNKDGSIVPQSTFSLSTLWPGSSNEGDPIVMYDRHADRWFISQFQFSPNRILIAISETNDPTGSYYAYSFSLSQFPDYPKYSIWWDAYYMSSNSTHTAVAFEREKMLNGDQSAQMISMSLPGASSFGFDAALPSDADGDLPPNGTPCYFFNLADNAFAGGQDRIEIFEMTCDWNNTNNSQVVQSQDLNVSSFDALFTGGLSNIAQPGTSQRLDAIMGVFMFRAQHMRWTGYNTMMLSHVVDMGSNRAGIRWYELRDANDGNWAVYQSGTYSPDNFTSRWMSSIAMDTWGNIGMAYSISNGSSVSPGLAYTGRLSSDMLGDMSYGEQVAINGSGAQTFTNRYGDYGHLALDPDGETFWYTGEYIDGSSQKTRIFSFNIKEEAGLENPYYDNLSMFVFQKESNLNVKVDGIHNNEKVELNLVAMNGQNVYTSKDIKPANNGIVQDIDVSNLMSGVYFVSVGNSNFQKVERIFIQR